MIRVAIRPEYAELYGVDPSSIPAPLEGETIGDYLLRSGLGDKENILPVVNGNAKRWDHSFADGDLLEIYPMLASG